MVGVPQVAPAAPVFFELPASPVIQLALISPQRFGIHAAQRAHPTIAGEDLFAQKTGIGAQPPFLHAGIAAKRESPFGDCNAAPAAEALLAPRNPSTGLGAASAHTRSSYPSPRIPSIMAARIWPTSSDDNVRSGDPTVTRKDTLFEPGGIGGSAYSRT